MKCLLIFHPAQAQAYAHGHLTKIEKKNKQKLLEKFVGKTISYRKYS